MCVYMYIHTYVYMCIHICMCIHIYISHITRSIECVIHVPSCNTNEHKRALHIHKRALHIHKRVLCICKWPLRHHPLLLVLFKNKFVCGTWFNMCDVIRSYTPTQACRNEAKCDWWCCMRREGGVCKWVMSHVWMGHVPHMYESRMYEWVIAQINESCPHTQMSHVTHIQESCHKYEWVMLNMSMSHVTNTNESCPTYKWVTFYIDKSVTDTSHWHEFF